jgi:membrane-associated phospholipid phosphatase
MNLYHLRNNIGFYAPFILFILSIFLLRHLTTYLYFFGAGFILNTILNIILKLIIKEPRPLKDKKAIEIGVTNGVHIGFDKFGMPSGHAQNCAFCLTFITMVLNNPFITCMYLLITGITLFERFKYNHHSILQLIIGTLIGIVFGYISYIIANNYITGNINMKEDENGPI